MEPTDLERYLRDITADMSRHEAFVFVHTSLPSASGSWIANLIGCHPATINRYLQFGEKVSNRVLQVRQARSLRRERGFPSHKITPMQAIQTPIRCFAAPLRDNCGTFKTI